MNRQAITLGQTIDSPIGVTLAMRVLPRDLHEAAYPGYYFYYSFAKQLAVALR